ncbi:MAG: tetratricopeptide repeat protein, partial [Candidatus Nealsonbacteria bacterium]|nr:tetratricopeptide repeat protein [Candidatus Nealsonbacteria bacterium]
MSLALPVLYFVPPAALPAADEPPAKAAEPAAIPTASETPLVDEKIRQLMQDRKYAEAVAAIDRAAAAANAPKDYLAYLKGRALYLQEEYDGAVAVFDGLAKQSPEGPWARRARFGKALALARKGDYRSAELIFRAEAEYLLSTDRKQQIADIYLEFADVYFKPPEKENRKPDYKKALEFYNKALDVGPKPEKRVEVELLVAQCQQNLGQHGEAAKLYEKFIEDHADSPLDIGLLEIEARYRLGECRLAEGNHKVARRTWQDLLAKHTDAKSERIAEAAFNLSRTWKIPQPEDNEQLNQGTAALEKFIERFPAHKLASQAHLDVARSFIHRGRYEDAVGALRRFLADERYKDREEIPGARNLLGRSYQLQKKFDLALTTWKDYLAKHPAHNAWSAVQREIINTEYLMGHEKYSEEQYEDAQKLWTEFITKYPLDNRNRNILLQFGTMQHKQKKYDEAIAIWRRLVSKYPNTNESSQAQYMIAATMEQHLATGDSPGATLEEALEEYRKVTWGSHVAAARQAAARLTARSMTVATERVFRSDETPTLKLTTRNIEKVTVRAYKVDMETYFRKMHLARGVEALDISLIDPDVTFEFEVPEYAKYQELENDLEVPLPLGKDDKELHSGVMAVTVSSKTLETTTLVIQSDLDVIVKSSRDEVFVFAENMRTGKPWPKARLLISNGSKVFAEATTGEDGTLQKAYKELKDEGQASNWSYNSNDVRVFAVADGHISSNVVGLNGVGVARGLADKGYIYTDRPAYRAGQMVHVRGCLRNVPGANDEARMTNDEEGIPPVDPPVPAEPPVSFPPSDPGAPSEPGDSGVRHSSFTSDVYTIDAGKKYTLEVFDGRNRLLRKEEVTLGEFGTFHTHFLLPPTCPQGQYRVLVRDENNGKSYQGSFQVHQYQLEPVRLAIDTDRHVYYRGEEIEGTIRAAYYYGAPLAGREILYRLADQRTHTATTDDKGEVRFKLPTREFSETQVLPLVVTLSARNLTTAANFVLSSQGFSVAAATVRPVYVAGETFEVTANAADAEGKPVARKLTLNVLEKTSVRGKVGERLVEKHELETDADEGTARQTLKLDDGGRYLIRIEGTDRFDNPISGQHLVRISDDKDDVRLRILADKHTFKVGDTAKVNLHWREEPALALITFQGARILDYQLFALNKGDNPLEIPMSARLAPNFELAVAVMTDLQRRSGLALTKPAEKTAPEPTIVRASPDLPQKRFHTASSPFAVQRELVVKLDTKRKGGGEGPIRPGEELEVSVTTTDAQGKAVAAEVSLAMVEQSLLGRFASPVPAIQDFFRGNLRQSAVRTTSSITFAYNPSTRPINPRLLAERDRIVVAAEEEESRRGAIAAAGSDAGLVGSIVVQESAPGDGPASSENAELVPGFQFAGSQTNGGLLAFDSALAVQNNAGTITLHNGQATVQLGGISRRVNLSAQTLGRNFNRSRNGGQGGAGGQQIVAFANGRDGQWGGGLYFQGASNLNVNGGVTLTAGDYIVVQPNAADINGLVDQQMAQVSFVDVSGNMQALNLQFGSGLAYGSADELAVELSKSGAVLLPGLARQETGYWNPAVTTGDDGKATVTFTMPDRSTAWTLMARGITAETLAGEATDEVVVKKELFGQLKVPAAFTDGDEAEIVASVHNDAIEKGQIDVTLKITIGDRTTEEKKTLDVTAKGIEELIFKTALNRPGKPADEKAPAAPPEINVAFELIVSAGEKQDVARRSVPLKPDGMPIFATTAGQATSDTTAWVEPPANMPLEYPSLQILIGPTVEQSLLDIVLGQAPLCQIEAGRIAAPLETAAADLMASLALQKLLGGARESGGPQAAALDGRVRSSVGLLVSSQNDDGGWSWTGGGLGGSSTATPSQRYGTCRVVWAMSLAKDAGYTVPDDSFNKALDYLRKQVPATANSDYESKAILLHALSTAGQGDFALANRLYRSRPALSTSALAYLALAFAEMDRGPTTQEVLTLLGERNLDTGGSSTATATERGGSACLPWSHSPAEIRALYALGLQEVSPQAPELKPLVEWLLAHRTGHRWLPDKATGPAAMALCRRSGLALTADGSTPKPSSGQAPTYKLAIFVNDVQAKVLEIDPAAGTQTVNVPAALLTKEPKQRIQFRITGRGHYTYQCILGGFVPSEKLKSTTDDWRVQRTYRPAPLEVDGREIARGFGVLTGSWSEFKNPLTQLPVGRRGLVELEVHRQNLPSNVPEQHLEYLVVTEPIPSGATVIEKSVRGPFERFEISPGAITFYIGSRRGIGTIHYELYGYLPGKYN